MVDPDAVLMTFTHRVLCNIPAEKSELPEAVSHHETFDDGMIQRRNGMRQNKYVGPCPPWGRHRYIFTVYALDVILKADGKMNKRKLLRAMRRHILAQAELTGYFSRKS